MNAARAVRWDEQSTPEILLARDLVGITGGLRNLQTTANYCEWFN